MKKIILLILTVTFIGCQLENKKNSHSRYVDTIYYDDGAIYEIVTYKDSLEDGPYKQYYPNGKIKSTG